MPMKCSLENTIHYVYWLHLESHTDIKTQGYVGITKVSPDKRFKQHKHKAKTKDFVVSKAIRKYGEYIKLKVICITDYAHSRYLERELRPLNFIGWNMNIGGKTSPQHSQEKLKAASIKANKTKLERGSVLKGKDHPMYGTTLSEEHKQKMVEGGRKHRASDKMDATRAKLSKSLKGHPHFLTDKWKRSVEYRAEKFRGVPLKEEHKDKLSDIKIEHYSKNGWWTIHNANHDAYKLADVIYNYYIKVAMGKRGLERLLGIPKDSISTIINHIKNGWIPIEDERWVSYYEKSN